MGVYRKNTRPPSITYNIAHLYRGLQSPDVDKRLFTCKTLYQTVFHEIQHHRQELMTKTNVSILKRVGILEIEKQEIMMHIQ